jgi:hypothetical protein
MSEKQFSHVCSACRTPNLVPPWKPSAASIGVSVAAALMGAWIGYSDYRPRYFALLGALVGLGIAYASQYYIIRKRALTCPSCHAERLIPVASPEGMRIMKELGFIES